MPRIRCHYIDCLLLDDGYCSAAAIELDPDTGCATYTRGDEVEAEDEDWVEEDEELEEWDEEGEDDDDELWADDEEEF